MSDGTEDRDMRQTINPTFIPCLILCIAYHVYTQGMGVIPTHTGGTLCHIHTDLAIHQYILGIFRSPQKKVINILFDTSEIAHHSVMKLDQIPLSYA